VPQGREGKGAKAGRRHEIERGVNPQRSCTKWREENPKRKSSINNTRGKRQNLAKDRGRRKILNNPREGVPQGKSTCQLRKAGNQATRERTETGKKCCRGGAAFGQKRPRCVKSGEKNGQGKRERMLKPRATWTKSQKKKKKTQKQTAVTKTGWVLAVKRRARSGRRLKGTKGCGNEA